MRNGRAECGSEGGLDKEACVLAIRHSSTWLPSNIKKPLSIRPNELWSQQICNDNGCLRAEPQCKTNPSFSTFKSPMPLQREVGAPPWFTAGKVPSFCFDADTSHTAAPSPLTPPAVVKGFLCMWADNKNDGLFNNRPLLYCPDIRPLGSEVFSRTRWPFTSQS